MISKLKNLFNSVKSDEKGFTLIEILVVIIVIGILFTVLISRMDVAGDQARTKGVQTDFRGFTTGAESLMRATAGQTINPTALNEYLDPAMKVSNTGTSPETSAETDPWGVAYDVVLEEKSGTQDYSLISFTSKGKGSDPEDEYTTVTYYYEGVVETCTTDTMGTNTIDLQILKTGPADSDHVCGDPITRKVENA